jgi:ABC-type tungstate transport system substrate-binding protein
MAEALLIVVSCTFSVALFPICMFLAYRAFTKVIINKNETSTKQLMIGLAWTLIAIVMIGLIIWGWSDGPNNG